MVLLSLLIGILGLYYGAEWLVRGASRVAAALHVSPLVIGLTVVAFGTSMPEMVACATAAWKGNTDFVLGNVFGSNIANVGLILGIAALIRIIPVKARLLRREVPLMLLATVVVYALAARGVIGRLEGAGLFLALVGFSWLMVSWARRERAVVREEFLRFEQEMGRRAGAADGWCPSSGRIGGRHRAPAGHQRVPDLGEHGRHRHLAAGVSHLGGRRQAR